VINHTFGSFHY